MLSDDSTKVRQVISPNDDTSLSTKSGWERNRKATAIAKASEPPAVPNARFWVASLWTATETTFVERSVHIECERWNDARAFATILAGGREVTVTPDLSRVPPRSRWQVRWGGSAMDTKNYLRLEARKNGSGDDFQPVREIVFS